MQIISTLIASLALASSASAHSSRLQHDEERLEFISKLNSMDKAWKADMNPRFRGLPIGHSKILCGTKPESFEDVRSYPRVSADPSLSIPDEFDSVKNWPECAEVIGDIRDQSDCGCCWAFGTSSAASDRLCIATKGKIKVPLSAEETCFCSEENGCGGGMLSTPWNYFKDTGVVTGGQFNNSYGTGIPFEGKGFCSDFSLPHCHHHGPVGKDPYPAEGQPGCPSQRSPACPTKCDDSAKGAYDDFEKDRYTFSGEITGFESAEAIQQAIMTYGPVSTAFSVFSDFENYAGGVYHHVSGSMMGGHAVRIVGWGVDSDSGMKYWKVANSWNYYWGENGYFRIKRGDDECGIESQAMADKGKRLFPY